MSKLHDAIIAGDLKAVKCLHEHGADIHACDDEALREAGAKENLDVFKYLLRLYKEEL